TLRQPGQALTLSGDEVRFVVAAVRLIADERTGELVDGPRHAPKRLVVAGGHEGITVRRYACGHGVALEGITVPTAIAHDLAAALMQVRVIALYAEQKESTP